MASSCPQSYSHRFWLYHCSDAHGHATSLSLGRCIQLVGTNMHFRLLAACMARSPSKITRLRPISCRLPFRSTRCKNGAVSRKHFAAMSMRLRRECSLRPASTMVAAWGSIRPRTSDKESWSSMQEAWWVGSHRRRRMRIRLQQTLG
jgi:hypothetical protein